METRAKIGKAFHSFGAHGKNVISTALHFVLDSLSHVFLPYSLFPNGSMQMLIFGGLFLVSTKYFYFDMVNYVIKILGRNKQKVG